MIIIQESGQFLCQQTSGKVILFLKRKSKNKVFEKKKKKFYWVQTAGCPLPRSILHRSRWWNWRIGLVYCLLFADISEKEGRRVGSMDT